MMLTSHTELAAVDRKAQAVFGQAADEVFVLNNIHAVLIDGRIFVLNADDDTFYLIHPHLDGFISEGNCGFTWEMVLVPIYGPTDVTAAIEELGETIRSRVPTAGR